MKQKDERSQKNHMPILFWPKLLFCISSHPHSSSQIPHHPPTFNWVYLPHPLSFSHPLPSSIFITLLSPLILSHPQAFPIFMIRYSYIVWSGLGSSVGIATGYGLDGPGIESRWRRDFPHLCRLAHPASCTMGTGSFPGIESGRGVTLIPHPF
jgi:hypothetical protein